MASNPNLSPEFQSCSVATSSEQLSKFHNFYQILRKSTKLPWHHNINYPSVLCLFVTQVFEGSQVSKATLCVQILKCRSLTEWQQRRPMVGIELSGQLTNLRCSKFSLPSIWCALSTLGWNINSTALYFHICQVVKSWKEMYTYICCLGWGLWSFDWWWGQLYNQ